ncbi:MAG: SAM-dependent methyltransferase [Bacteroidota bacterium]
MTGTLYLLPVGLGGEDLKDVLPQKNFDLIKTLTYFIAENAKEARAFLKQCAYPEISRAEFSLINQHAKQEELLSFLTPLIQGHDMGLMSDAGCPGIADPGAEMIQIAHQKGIKVVPLVGPSSIVLSIMASGFNGQNFAFIGYLPIDKTERLKRIREVEQHTIKFKQAQFFIETPYRNQNLFEDLLKNLAPTSKLLVATNITLGDESIMVKTIAAWKKSDIPDFVKKPTIFGIYI